jgi:hypothetical protein
MLLPFLCLMETSNFFETQINQTTIKCHHQKLKILRFWNTSL